MAGVEILGTMASVIVAISLMLKNIRWLRTVNLVGSGAFAIYGWGIGAWPVFGLNAFIVVVNVFYLVQMARQADRFSLLEVTGDPGAGRVLLDRFLEAHGPDLARFQPDWPRRFAPGDRVFFVLREVLPIALLAVRPRPDGQQDILVDYAVPAWRDYRNARFVFTEGLKTAAWGPGTVFRATARVRAHEAYLRRLGFRNEADGVWTFTT